MSSIGSIITAKELAASYQPLFLLELLFSSGQYLHLSSHPLSSRYGGVPTNGTYQYGGIEWLPKAVGQNIGAIQSMSDLGVDIPPQVSIHIADPDKDIFTNWELAQGFKGAVLTIYVVMWDAANLITGSFSSDNPALIKFRGTCSAMTESDEGVMTITATSLLNMTQQ
jgi:hypothetical protein